MSANGTEKKRGKFIVFEGIDGCGKTTHAGLLCDYVAKKTGHGCLLEREPDSRDLIGAIIRTALYGGVKFLPETMAYLHVADISADDLRIADKFLLRRRVKIPERDCVPVREGLQEIPRRAFDQLPDSLKVALLVELPDDSRPELIFAAAVF